MTQALSDLLRGMILFGAIACGAYAYGTPGDQLVAAFFTGMFSVMFVQSSRWFRE